MELQELYDSLSMPVTNRLGTYEEIFIRGEDGVGLRTQFYFPDVKEPVSTIVVRCCYADQVEKLKIKADAYVKRGFGFVVQWCRGTVGSEGVWEPNVNERKDGLNLLNYLENDDRILNMGYWGDSYLAMTGWVMADALPAKMKTMFLGVYGCDRYTSAYKDGLFRQDILTGWAMGNAGVKVEADYLESAAYRPQIEVDEKLWGVRLEWYRDWISNVERGSDYWKTGFWKDLIEIPGKINIPLFIKEGWYDHHLGSAMVTYNKLSDYAKEHSVLQIGPWNHDYKIAVEHQDMSKLVDDSAETPMRWFDSILRKGEIPKKEARVFVVGANEWVTLNDWPLADTDKAVFDLSANSRLIRSDRNENNDGALSLNAEHISYIYDPSDPVMSHGAESLFSTKPEVGSLLQPGENYRPDVISFVSDELDEDLEIIGDIEVVLKVSSDAKDTAFTAKLMEVYEDGSAYNVRGTITTLALRNDADVYVGYDPNEKVSISLKMWPIAWKLNKGSKLRLDISSSDFPQYAVHGNLEGPWSMQKDVVKAKQTIWLKGSRVVLPVKHK